MSTNPPRLKGLQSFTEDEIRTRAYKIWFDRNGTSNHNNRKSTPEDDWNDAIESLRLECSRSKRINGYLRFHHRQSLLLHQKISQQLLSPFINREDRDFNLEVVKTLISSLSLIATVIAGVGLLVTYQNARYEQSINNKRFVTESDRLITDRFSKAVDQLGSDKLEIRLGGIYELERISKDSDKDYWAVMEVLTAFVREHTKESPKTTEIGATQTSTDSEQIPPLPTDIQAVLTVIKRRKFSYGNGEDNLLDLSKTNLRKARLTNANLQQALLFNANLQRAVLFNTNLQRAYLNSTNLQEAYLEKAKLQKAYYSDNSTTPETCKRFYSKYPCPTIFPKNFDPIAAGMVLVK